MTSSALGKLKLKTQDESRYGKIVHSGFLNKMSKGNKFTQRWAVLWEDTALRFYSDKDRGNVIGKIKMKYVDEVRQINTDYDNNNNNNNNNEFKFVLSSNSLKKNWQFGCNENETLNQWIHILRSAAIIKKQQKQKQKQQSQSKAKPQPQPTQPQPQPQAINKYIGHHGRNLSNMDDFSKSSQISSMNSLSALSIMSAINDAQDLNNHHTSSNVMNSVINEEEDDMIIDADDDDDDPDYDILQKEINLSETLNAENEKYVFSGVLERKTNNRVLGKHLWESRYFKLSIHSLFIYQNINSLTIESIIKLSSIISVNRNTKNNGFDLKDNRFDINIKNPNNPDLDIVELRTKNDKDCQQWIHHLSKQKKAHRKSIRSGLRYIQNLKKRNSINNNDDNNNNNNNNNNNSDNGNKIVSKPVRKAFKRQRTSRGLSAINDDEDDKKNESDDGFDVNYRADIDNHNNKKHNSTNSHSRNLSMGSWVKGIKQDVAQQNDKQYHHSQSHSQSTVSFEGFLIRKIGGISDNNHISEKIYVRLSDDTLEFSAIDQNITNQNIHSYHQKSILGTVSVEHIREIKLISSSNNEFMIIFNDNNSQTDWNLTVPKGENKSADQWVKILETAIKEAKAVENTILNDNKKNNNNNNNKGGSIQALRNMINAETMLEMQNSLSGAGTHSDYNNFEITKLENNNNNNNKTNTGGLCSCFCFK